MFQFMSFFSPVFILFFIVGHLTLNIHSNSHYLPDVMWLGQLTIIDQWINKQSHETEASVSSIYWQSRFYRCDVDSESKPLSMLR